MRRLTYENSRGESIEFYHSPLLIESLTGIGGVEADLQSQKSPNQDGDTHIRTVLNPRFINLVGSFVPRDLVTIRKHRREIARICNPKLDLGTLTLEIDGDVKQIKCILDGGPVFPERGNNVFQTFMITFKCPNPYWLDQLKTDQLVVWEGGLTFPLRLPTKFARLSSKKAKILLNEGDVETPILVTFNGPATAPITIKNLTTGQYIQVNRDLVAGEKLEINTAFGQKRVTKILEDGTRENATHYMKMPGSEFLNLEVGNNLFEYSTGLDYEQAGVSIQWRNRFLAL